jgi:hypothetical protein
MSIATYRDLLLERLRSTLPRVLERYRRAYEVDASDAPDPEVYAPGPPPMTSAEGYPAVYVTPLELVALRRSETPGEFNARYRYEVIVYVRGSDMRHAQVVRDALGASLRAALLEIPRLSPRVTLSTTTLVERYSAIEAVAGGTLAGVGAEVELHAEEESLPPLPLGNADTIEVDVRSVAVPEPIE